MKKIWVLGIALMVSFTGHAEYTAKDYSYLTTTLEGFDKELIEMHLKLYAGYVKNTNLLTTLLDKDQEPAVFGALKRRYGFEYDGMVLHELYFENLGESQGLIAESKLYKQIKKDFGSYKNWETDFKKTGMLRGVGWVVLYQDPGTGTLFNDWIDEHHISHLAGAKPILVMDVWEHAYLTQFGLNRASYIDTFFKNIKWSVVMERLSGKKNEAELAFKRL